jgi:hypothetical protein
MGARRRSRSWTIFWNEQRPELLQHRPRAFLLCESVKTDMTSVP